MPIHATGCSKSLQPISNILAQLNPTTGLVGSLPILFASRQFDAETGLYYHRARYLDPTTGRWTTQDPMGFSAGDANLYCYVGNRATLATDPSGLICRQVGDFLWGVGKGIVEVPAMFLDLGHSVGALAYMEITGRPYIPTYLSMTAQAADRASLDGGREAIGELLANAYFDLFTFGVRPLFHAMQEAVNGNCEPLGQFTGMLIFGWAVGGGGFRLETITLPEGPRPVLAFAGGGEVALAAPRVLAIPVPHGLPIPIIWHMTVPDPSSTPNGQNSSQSAATVSKEPISTKTGNPIPTPSTSPVLSGVLTDAQTAIGHIKAGTKAFLERQMGCSV